MLVEDNAEYRQVIAPAINDELDIDLASQFGTAERALDSLQEQADSVKPDVILLDLRLPGMDGLSAIEHLRAQSNQAKIIVLTQSDHEEDVLRAISCGAAGYLLKSATLSQITDGIRTVYTGGGLLNTKLAAMIMRRLKKLLPSDERLEMLTEREVEVLSLLADGCERKSIADQLRISNATVCTHVAHIYEKLKVQNAPAAVAKAFRFGVLPTQ
ncbi:Response regulator protein VraR [Aureliella helgolandensis]|uniref:Response regulator protein VraR n=2 Tax=Aureliella helgolandensis TaxID=2527968 RepID=A0A518G9C1_9BACT|nr:Response regulator protein VraR [Aureliella helgolandensis]